MEAHQLCVYVGDQSAVDDGAPCEGDGGGRLCTYGEPRPPYYSAPCSSCERVVPVLHPVYAVGRMCDSCMSVALASHTLFAISATTTPPSSSSDFGDSKYGDDAAPQTRLNQVEPDHPEQAQLALQAEPPPTREVVPRWHPTCGAEPMAVRASEADQRRFEELARIFFAPVASPWHLEKQTWFKVTRSRYLGWSLLPLPERMSQLAVQLMYVFPAGLVVFYTAKLAAHHYHTDDEMTRTTIGSATSMLRKRHGLCTLIYVRQTYVGVLEVLTHPEQTQHGADLRSVVEEAAARLTPLPHRRRQQQY